MDTLRGNFASDDGREYDPAEDETGREAPPAPIGQDERRMQVRAYNHWASLLQNRNFPSIEDLHPESLPDFGPYSVLLDFTSGVENPGITYLGDKLATECGADDQIEQLEDVPSRSLLSRITDHYMQILANQAPIGFEAEFVNQQQRAILYRGILLPFSSDDDTIDFIYGVINWKELADQFTTDELLLEIDQALEQDERPRSAEQQGPTRVADDPLIDSQATESAVTLGDIGNDDILDLDTAMQELPANDVNMPTPSFGSLLDMATSHDDEEDEEDPCLEPDGQPRPERPNALQAMLDAAVTRPSSDDTLDGSDEAQNDQEPDIALASPVSDEMELGDWLASAREFAQAARQSEDRTRQALYAAIGRAYDFSIAARRMPEEFAELVADSGLTMQERAPMTPVVKLVFGADYDKTRLTEYAAALSHGHRLGIECGDLAEFLMSAKGGLKAIVAEERRRRREESGKPTTPASLPRERIARKLRQIEPASLESVARAGEEFGLVMIRRLADGEVVVLGEVPDDGPLIERAARKLLG